VMINLRCLADLSELAGFSLGWMGFEGLDGIGSIIINGHCCRIFTTPNIQGNLA